nr:GH25 family lysozyme [Lacticaseibacillus zhaodongensis]
MYGQASDTFLIAQIGGYNGRMYWQPTYASQVRNALAKGKHAHAYIWGQFGGSQTIAKQVMDTFLPHIGLPKGAIVAIDYEAGASHSKAANTAAIAYGMRRIKQAGYTPMYYSYKPYTQLYVDSAALVREFGKDKLWIASYPYLRPVLTPDFNYFPSLEGIGIWQFTNKYGREGGLDGNVDLTGITLNGYTKKPTAIKLPAKKPVKKEDEEMQKRSLWPVDYVGVAYPYEDADTYKDVAMRTKFHRIQKGKAYRIFELRDGVVDLGSQWAATGNLNCNFNPLPSGGQNAVYNAKPVLKTKKDGSTVTLEAGKWKAFGLKDGRVDLGGGESGSASDFRVLL